MGWLRKVGKKIGRGIRKVGRKIKQAFGDAFDKLGPVGLFALYFIMPTIAHSWSKMLTTVSKWGQDGNFAMQAAGKLAEYTHLATDGIGKLSNGLTGAMESSLNLITEPFLGGPSKGIGSRFSNFLNDKRQDFNLDQNNKWIEKMTRPTEILKKDVVFAGTEDSDGDSLLKQTGTAALQQGTFTVVDTLISKALEEPDTGAKGAVFGLQTEEGRLASLTLPPALQVVAGPTVSTYDQLFNSNLYGTGDPIWQAWHRNDKFNV